MEEQQRQLATALVTGSPAVSGAGSGSGGGVRWTETVSFVAGVSVCAAVAGGLTWWWLQRRRADAEDDEDEDEDEEVVDLDAQLEEVWAKCPDELLREFRPTLESMVRLGAHPATIADGLLSLESIIGSEYGRLQGAGVWLVLVLFLSLKPTGRPGEPTPLLDDVYALLGFAVPAINRFDEPNPGYELVQRHARRIFARSGCEEDRKVCVWLLNQLSLAPQRRSLSDASAKATIRLFARAIVETPLPDADRPLSEIHLNAIDGLYKFLMLDRNDLVDAVIMNEAQCFEQLVSLLEHEIVRSIASHQQDKKLLVTTILLQLCVSSVMSYYAQHKDEGVLPCVERLCNTTVAEFLVSILHDNGQLESRQGTVLWLAFQLYLMARRSMTRHNSIRRSDNEGEGGGSIFDLMLSVVEDHTRWSPQCLSYTLVLIEHIVLDFGVAREQARANDKFMAVVLELASGPRLTDEDDPVTIAQGVLDVLKSSTRPETFST